MSETMRGKNIIVCSDGTGNTTIKGRGTNVFKLFEALDLNGHRYDAELVPQIAFYDDGVGTETFKPIKVFAGMTGFGLGRNVRQLYKEIVRVYDPGDRLYLFGFSRGAFTVRTLNDLLLRCGVLKREKFHTAADLRRGVDAAYRAYRRCYRTRLVSMLRGEPDVRSLQSFRNEHCREELPRVSFVGVWDTVDAVGTPFHISDFVNMFLYRFKFPDLDLNPAVERACHALAIDDSRHSFHPLLWNADKVGSDRIQQVWFAGAHSNVGGGYPQHGVSLVALDWMMEKAAAAGLRISPSIQEHYRERANIDDRLYDPRAGVGIFYRWKPRDIGRLCQNRGVAPVIHLSVAERIAHGTGDYAPGNLPANVTVTYTPTGDVAKDAVADLRAKAAEEVIRRAHSEQQPLLAQVRVQVSMGLTSYYTYLASVALLAIGSLVPQSSIDIAALAAGVFNMQASVVLDLFRWTPPTTVTMVLVSLGLSGAYVMAQQADRRMSARFSSFWYRHQQELREAFKGVRSEVPR